MNDQVRVNQELIDEISALKRKVKELEQSESERKLSIDALRVSEEKNKELAAIDRLVRAVSSLLSLEEVCRTAAHQLGQTLNSDAVVIFVREGNDLRLMASTCGPKIHPTEIEAVQRACESIGGRSVTAKQPVYVANILKDPRCTQQECRNAGLHAYASIPLSLDDQLIGLLVVASATERDFSLSAGYFETAADQIATTIRNVQRLDEARGYASQLQQTITEFKRAEEALLLNARCNQTLLRLGQMAEASQQEITGFALEEAVQLRISGF